MPAALGAGGTQTGAKTDPAVFVFQELDRVVQDLQHDDQGMTLADELSYHCGPASFEASSPGQAMRGNNTTVAVAMSRTPLNTWGLC